MSFVPTGHMDVSWKTAISLPSERFLDLTLRSMATASPLEADHWGLSLPAEIWGDVLDMFPGGRRFGRGSFCIFLLCVSEQRPFQGGLVEFCLI